MDSNAISRLVAERRQLAAIQMQLQPMPMMPGLQFPLQPMVSQAQMQQFLTQQQMFTFGQQAQIPMQMIDPQQQTRDLKQRDRDDDDDGEDDKDDDRYDDDHYDGRSNRRERRQRERSGRDRDRGRDRSRDRSRDRDRDYRDRDYRGCEDKGSDSKWMTDTPTNTILLKGLPNNIDEKDICGELMIQGLAVKDVRLMKRKDTGESRGFAFAEFQTVDDATQWMEQNQGEVMLLNEHTVRMFYSTPKSREGQDSRQLADWTCSKCGFNNFKRREQCHKCYMTRTESERLKEGDGYDQVGTNPCNTLILRGLDALTTEENIISAISKISALQVKNVKVLRDDLTGTSRGYGFVELGSLQESTQVLATLHRLNHPFEIDGKAVVVSFAKNTYSTVIATMSQSYEYPTTSSYDAENGGSSSQPFDGNNRWGGSGFQNYDQNFQTDKTNAAAAVAQAALQAAQAAKAREKQMEETAGMSAEEKLAHQAAQWSAQQQQQLQDAETTPATSAALTTYPTPDVSTYQYDDSSGYYYDSVTGLYYDASSQYYYNSGTGQFLYWDGEQQTYLPANNNGKGEEEKERKNGKEEKKEKVKVAKKIAKDMEKWAKSMNAQKEALKDNIKRSSMPSKDRESAAADAGFALLEKTKSGEAKKSKDDKSVMPPPAASSKDSPALVACYGGDSDEEESEEDGVVDEEKLIDWNKIACLLCKRQFPAKEALQRHIQLSDLHKKNLDDLKLRKETACQQYRDRAKERRQKYGAPEPPLPHRGGRKGPHPTAQVPVPYEEPTKSGLSESNVGSKMMSKMGWTKGKGLGRSNQGIVDPIEATRRQGQAGLGARGSRAVANIQPGDTYKDCVKKTLFARFHDLD